MSGLSAYCSRVYWYRLTFVGIVDGLEGINDGFGQVEKKGNQRWKASRCFAMKMLLVCFESSWGIVALVSWQDM